MSSYPTTNDALITDQERSVSAPRWTDAQPSAQRHPHPAAAPRWARNIWQLAALPLLLFFLIPLVVLVLRTTPERLLASLQDKAVYLALAVSLKTTLISLGIILLLGSPLAFLLARYEFRYKSLVDTLIDIPTVLPPSVAGLALLLTFGRNGPLGHVLGDLKVSLAFTQAAVVMAQIFIAAPYYVRAATLGFAAVDSEYIQAAQLDGADRWQILRYLVLPLAQSALIGGAILSWARALGEFGATILFAGNFLGRTQTMPLAIYLGFESNLDVALTLSVILVLFSFSALIIVKSVLRRNGES